jgi:hypothetical protein
MAQVDGISLTLGGVPLTANITNISLTIAQQIVLLAGDSTISASVIRAQRQSDISTTLVVRVRLHGGAISTRRATLRLTTPAMHQEVNTTVNWRIDEVSPIIALRHSQRNATTRLRRNFTTVGDKLSSTADAATSALLIGQMVISSAGLLVLAAALVYALNLHRDNTRYEVFLVLGCGIVWSIALLVTGAVSFATQPGAPSHQGFIDSFYSHKCEDSEAAYTPYQIAAVPNTGECLLTNSVGESIGGAMYARMLCGSSESSGRSFDGTVRVATGTSMAECKAAPWQQVEAGACVSGLRPSQFAAVFCAPQVEASARLLATRAAFEASDDTPQHETNTARLASQDALHAVQGKVTSFIDGRRVATDALRMTPRTDDPSLIAYTKANATALAPGVAFDDVRIVEDDAVQSPAVNNFKGVKRGVVFDSSGGPHRFVGVAGTGFDVGTLGKEFTITFWLRASNTTRGLVFAVVDDWREDRALRSPVVEALTTAMTGSTALTLDERLRVYSAVHVNGATKQVRFAAWQPETTTLIDLRWSVGLGEMADVFDDEWHLIALGASSLLGRSQMQIFVDGVTSYREDAFRQCLPRGAKVSAVRSIAGQRFHVHDPLSESVIDGGALIVGSLDAAVFGLEMHPQLLFQGLIATMGTPRMVELGQVDIDHSRTVGAVLAGLVGIVFLINGYQIYSEIRVADGRMKNQVKLTSQGGSKVKQLAVIVPLVSTVFQGMILYFGGWQWPVEFELPFSFIFFSLAFEFNIVFPSVSFLTLSGTFFAVSLGAVCMLFAFGPRDDKQFRAIVIDPVVDTLRAGLDPKVELEDLMLPEPDVKQTMPPSLRFQVGDNQEVVGAVMRTKVTRAIAALIKNDGGLRRFDGDSSGSDSDSPVRQKTNSGSFIDTTHDVTLWLRNNAGANRGRVGRFGAPLYMEQAVLYGVMAMNEIGTGNMQTSSMGESGGTAPAIAKGAQREIDASGSRLLAALKLIGYVDDKAPEAASLFYATVPGAKARRRCIDAMMLVDADRGMEETVAFFIEMERFMRRYYVIAVELHGIVEAAVGKTQQIVRQSAKRDFHRIVTEQAVPARHAAALEALHASKTFESAPENNRSQKLTAVLIREQLGDAALAEALQEAEHRDEKHASEDAAAAAQWDELAVAFEAAAPASSADLKFQSFDYHDAYVLRQETENLASGAPSVEELTCRARREHTMARFIFPILCDAGIPMDLERPEDMVVWRSFWVSRDRSNDFWCTLLSWQLQAERYATAPLHDVYEFVGNYSDLPESSLPDEASVSAFHGRLSLSGGGDNTAVPFSEKN